jgi:hypothetical protein
MRLQAISVTKKQSHVWQKLGALALAAVAIPGRVSGRYIGGGRIEPGQQGLHFVG